MAKTDVYVDNKSRLNLSRVCFAINYTKVYNVPPYIWMLCTSTCVPTTNIMVYLAESKEHVYYVITLLGVSK